MAGIQESIVVASEYKISLESISLSKVKGKTCSKEMRETCTDPNRSVTSESSEALDEAQLAARREVQHRQREVPRCATCRHCRHYLSLRGAVDDLDFRLDRLSLQSWGCILLEWILTMCQRLASSKNL